MGAYVRKPYRSRYGRKFSTARGSSTHTVNKPVRAIQKKKCLPTAAKNSKAITTLSKQVKSLQVSQLGQFQKRIEHCRLSPSTFPVTTQSPAVFLLNDFTTVAKLYKPNDTLDSLDDHHWSLYTYPSVTTDDKYNFWRGCNDDSVDVNLYLPIRTKLSFQIWTSMNSSDTPRYVRIDFVKPKKIVRTSTERQFNMPECSHGLGKLCHVDMHQRNTINPTYYTIIKTKFMKFKAPDTATNMWQTRSCYYTHTFPPKILKLDPNITNMQQQLTQNVADQVWAIISVSNPLNPNNNNAGDFDISLKRENHFRDQFGAAS